MFVLNFVIRGKVTSLHKVIKYVKRSKFSFHEFQRKTYAKCYFNWKKCKIQIYISWWNVWSSRNNFGEYESMFNKPGPEKKHNLIDNCSNYVEHLTVIWFIYGSFLILQYTISSSDTSCFDGVYFNWFSVNPFYLNLDRSVEYFQSDIPLSAVMVNYC